MDGMNNLDIKKLEEEVKNCKKCPLWKERTNVVFGEGDIHSKIMFIGEAPGFHEDQEGRPFVGAAGKLLTNLIESLGLKREEVYIANVLKCRPPNNREPNPDEIKACYPYLEAQIKIINPRIICTLGRYSAYAILKTPINMSSYHGKTFSIEDRLVFVTYHPAAALYHAKVMDEIKRDFEKLKDLIEKETSESKTLTKEQLSFW